MSVTGSTDAAARDNPRDSSRDALHRAAREIGAASVDADNPWLGLASFTEESQAYFFGREGEVAELTRRVQRKLLTVLFGKSGLGKTSILRAGLVPRLRAQAYFPVYLRIDYGHDSPEPSEQIKQAINRAARDLGSVAGAEREGGGHWSHPEVAAPGESIWEFLHHRDDVLKDSSGQTLIPLLIFDQFEELFTLAQSDEFGRARAARFIEELADLVENRPPKALEAKLDTDESIAERFDFSRSDYRVVIALREDYLAPLESLKKTMPSLSQNRLRLAPMTGSQALEAVLQPGNRLRRGRPLVTEEVAEAIVRFVAGGSELANAEVEPSLLSLICRELNEQRIAQGRSEISQDLLAGSHDTILSNFYERSLADQPESVRRIVEDDLLTESGYRENLAEESLLRRFQAAGAAPDALTKLVNRRLLRIEERLDVRRVELTHDVLTGVVKASRDQRHEREACEATERALAEQREREHAARRALRRARAVAAGCALLALLALAATVAAFFSMQRARRAELVARQTRAVSEQARQEAEGLLGFLTDSFVRELETFGREQTIAELSQREIDYFQHLPPQLEDPETVRSGALALTNHAMAVGLLGNNVGAIKNATDAVALLESLRRTDKSDATMVALGGAYANRGNMYWIQANGGRADIDLQRASDLLRPVAERSGASVEARRAYLEALAFFGCVEFQSNQNEHTVQDEREAMRVGQELGAPDHADANVDADYAMAEMDLSGALANLDRNEEARRMGEDAVTLADRLLAQHPQFGEVLIVKQIASFPLGEVALNELDPAEAVRFGLQEERTSLALVAVEPRNAAYLNELGVAYEDISESLWDAGRLVEAVGYGRKALETFRQDAVQGLALSNLAEDMAATAPWQAQLGDFSGAAATVAANDPFLSPSLLHKAGLSGSYAEAEINAWRAYPAAALAYERADWGRARRFARSALSNLHAAGPHPPPEEIGWLNLELASLSDLEARADYNLGDFAAAAQAERTALQASRLEIVFRTMVSARQKQRTTAQIATWLSMALAREGNRAEAAHAIGPVVTMYRGLERVNHGNQWLPLELAEALYAQSLADPQHRAALLREASALVDHLIPAIAKLHDTREWRARIEAARRAGGAQ